MSQRFWVIGYRPYGQEPLFFRGDGRYAVKLPALNRVGWVEEIEHARLFVRPPDFNPDSVSKTLDASCITVYPYERDVGPHNVIRPTTRPTGYKNRFDSSGKPARKKRTVPKRKKKDTDEKE